MRQSVRLALAALCTPVLLAACDHGIVDPGTSPDARVRYSLDGDTPIDQGGGGIGDGGGGLEGGGDGGGTGGGGTAEPFNPPPLPLFVDQPLYHYDNGVAGNVYSCGQTTHAFYGLASGWSNDVTQGTILYFSGVVVPGSRMRWGFYNASGQLVKTHLTQAARSNCVVHHEAEAVSTADLAPGYYHLIAAYYGLERNGAEDSYGIARAYTRYVGPIRIR